MTLDPTPGQTVGPFYGYALPFPGDNELVAPGHPDAVRLHGTVYDGAGNPVPDALLEIWQAGSDGQVAQVEGSLRRDGWTFTGFGRTAVDDNGHYSFTTVQPGAIPGAGGERSAPFFAMTIFARGLLDALFTRAYLPYGNLAGETLLASLSEERRNTLICQSERSGYRFDVHLQGAQETVFLAYPRIQHD